VQWLLSSLERERNELSRFFKKQIAYLRNLNSLVYIMNNPFYPVLGTGGGQLRLEPDFPVVLHQESAMEPPPFLPQDADPLPLNSTEENPPKKEKKKGFFSKIFGGRAPAIKAPCLPADEVEEEGPFVLPKKPTDSELVTKRHAEFIQSVDDICKSLESTQPQRGEVSVTDILPPIPVENLDALTQVKVTGVLEKVADRLEEASKRDDLVMDSLTQVDGTLAALSRSSERSVTTMDGMKVFFTQVSGSMESMQSELKKSGRRYEDLCEKVRKSDQARAAKIAKLQKRTLMVTSLIGVAVVVALLLVAFGR
jgi:hypothetical protein|tara:strand:- start:1409 stop:2338 length:930 start_codon:yes stop_codon:yes gene_type:complete